MGAKLQKQSSEVFCKKDLLKNFAKFTGKRLCQSLFFHKVADITLYFTEHLWWLLQKEAQIVPQNKKRIEYNS